MAALSDASDTGDGVEGMPSHETTGAPSAPPQDQVDAAHDVTSTEVKWTASGAVCFADRISQSTIDSLVELHAKDWFPNSIRSNREFKLFPKQPWLRGTDLFKGLDMTKSIMFLRIDACVVYYTRDYCDERPLICLTVGQLRDVTERLEQLELNWWINEYAAFGLNLCSDWNVDDLVNILFPQWASRSREYHIKRVQAWTEELSRYCTETLEPQGRVALVVGKTIGRTHRFSLSDFKRFKELMTFLKEHKVSSAELVMLLTKAEDATFFNTKSSSSLCSVM